MTKIEQRKMLEESMALFISNGGSVTKHRPRGKQRFSKKEQESDVVEIEVEALPLELQAKFFPEEV